MTVPAATFPDASALVVVDAGRARPGAASSAPDRDAEIPRDAPVPDATLVVKDASVPDDSDTGVAEPKPAVTFDLVTKPLPGEGRSFQPRNILAIWVEDANARPVKVLCVLAGIMRTRLPEFNRRFPMFFGGFTATPHPDVITGATRREHRPVRMTWDLTDLEQRPVRDGRYAIVVELTDRNDRSALLSVPFENNGRPATVEVPDGRDFGPALLVYDP